MYVQGYSTSYKDALWKVCFLANECLPKLVLTQETIALNHLNSICRCIFNFENKQTE